LLDTDYRTTADSTGDFQISNLLPGPYSIAAIDGRLADLGVMMTTLDAFSAERDSVVRVTPVVPSASQYIAGNCDADSAHYRVVVARVLKPDGEPADDAGVEVWSRVAGGYLQRIVAGKADANGIFFVCRAPRGTPIEIAAEHDGAAQVLVLPELTTDIVATKIQLKRRPP
jgi:hypothetical protein